MWGMCGPITDSEERPNRGNFRVEEEFKWSMPFETIGDDMRAIHADVVRFIGGLQHNMQERIIEDAVCAPMRCGCQDDKMYDTRFAY